MRREIIRLAWPVIGEQVLVTLTGMLIYGRFQSQAWKAVKV